MQRELIVVALSAGVIWGGECVRPATTIRSVDSPFAFSTAVIAALATAHLAYGASLLSPERTVGSAEPQPLGFAKDCIKGYMAPFVGSKVKEIEEAASTIQLAMTILSSNEQEVYEVLGTMSKRKASQPEMLEYLQKFRDDGQGRWYIFLNATTSTIFSIGVFENLKSEKPDIISTLQSDEAEFLRLEICRHFLLSRLTRPSQIRPSPEKGAAMLYHFLQAGKISLTNPDWK